MRIYLASRYSRRVELCGYRAQLRALGHEVDAVWLNGGHQIDDRGQPIGEAGEALVEGDSGDTSAQAAALRTQFAQEDFRDVANCELLIAFTEPPPIERDVWIVGHRENIFCWLPRVSFFATWTECLSFLRTESRHEPTA